MIGSIGGGGGRGGGGGGGSSSHATERIQMPMVKPIHFARAITRRSCHRLRLTRKSWSLISLVLIGLLPTLCPSNVQAGAWSPAKGEGYAKLGLRWLPGTGYHDGAGNTFDTVTTHELRLDFYGELGLGERSALVVNTDLLRLFALDDDGAGGSPTRITTGDPTIGLRYQFLREGRWAAAAEMLVSFPLASSRSTPIYLGAEQVAQIRPGRGTLEFEPVLSVGRGWDDFYAAAALSYAYRTENFDDVLRWSIEGGYAFTRDLAARLRFAGAHPLGNGEAAYHESTTGMGNGTSYVAFTLEGDYQFIPVWYVGAAFAGGIVHVRRQMGGPVINLYVATRF